MLLINHFNIILIEKIIFNYSNKQYILIFTKLGNAVFYLEYQKIFSLLYLTTLGLLTY